MPPPRNTLRKERREGKENPIISSPLNRDPGDLRVWLPLLYTPNHRIGGGGHRPKIPPLPTYTQTGRKSHDNSMIIAQIPPSSSSCMMEGGNSKIVRRGIFFPSGQIVRGTAGVCVFASLALEEEEEEGQSEHGASSSSPLVSRNT